jgi:hypothetical protein
MKEAALASCLVQVLGLATTSNDGRQLLMWKTSAGSASGDLSVIASKVDILPLFLLFTYKPIPLAFICLSVGLSSIHAFERLVDRHHWASHSFCKKGRGQINS